MLLNKDEIAWHEAGHIIVAKSFGLELKALRVTKERNTVAVNFGSIDELDSFQKACLAMSGYIAAKEYSKTDPVECMMHSKGDYDRVKHILANTDIDKQEVIEYIYDTFTSNYTALAKQADKIKKILDFMFI